MTILEGAVVDRRSAMANADGSLSDEAYDRIIAHTHSPWVLFIAARLELRLGAVQGARRFLKAVLEHPGSRERLWTWRNLRSLGETVPSERSSDVLGVIVETSAGGGIDLLAAYDDGTARYLDHEGGAIVYEVDDPLVTPIVKETVAAAFLNGVPHEGHGAEPPGAGQARVSVLSPGGTMTWSGDPDSSEHAHNLIACAARLLDALVDAAQRQ